MQTYTSFELQPHLGRVLDELPDDEKPIFEKFTNAEFVDSLIKLLSLEENKGKDRFHAKFFILFKVLVFSL
jgi:hypothetical protein